MTAETCAKCTKQCSQCRCPAFVRARPVYNVRHSHQLALTAWVFSNGEYRLATQQPKVLQPGEMEWLGCQIRQASEIIWSQPEVKVG